MMNDVARIVLEGDDNGCSGIRSDLGGNQVDYVACVSVVIEC